MGCACVRDFEVRPVDLRTVYSIGNVLGTGAFGQVRSCVNKTTRRQYAVKIMAKVPRQRHGTVDFAEMFRNEVDILQGLDHENIIRYHEFYEDKHFLYAIIDKCEGGELYQSISSKTKFYEADVSRICQQMLRSVQYLREQNIVHRDIKAQNFLFRDKPANSPLVLIDFGMAVKLDQDQYLSRLCGSPHYVSPELVARHYKFSVDVWAIGVVVYLLTYGKYPFEGSDRNSIMKKVASQEPKFDEGPSADLLDLLKGLLTRNPQKRLTPEQALAHKWNTPRPTESDVEVPRDSQQGFERMMTMEKDVAEEKEYDRKLSEMKYAYRQHSRKLSSATKTVHRASGERTSNGSLVSTPAVSSERVVEVDSDVCI
eukprot:Lankesteria_metandrocarpae@DN9338_c0_g1_i1.p1